MLKYALVLMVMVSACSFIRPAKEIAVARIEKAAREYCMLPESVRLEVREQFKISPTKAPYLQVLCENL